jgi:L-ascorbate metabolism protein UlaG (beta-lactamase superfamily)
MRRFLVAVVALLVVAAGWLVYQLNDRPELAAYDGLLLEHAPGKAVGGRVAVTFLGVSTLLISDGQTALMIDGFFTRPPLFRTIAGRVSPDADQIARCLDRIGVEGLAAVIVVHSHYDHAMDAPEVARRTGALVIGSESTANVARGVKLPAEQIHIARLEESMRFGEFEVTLVRSEHFPHGMAMGEIKEPLVPPARASAYLEGGSFSVFVRHRLGTLLVQGSAGFVPGQLADRRADVVLLGVGGLGSKDGEYRDAYFREVPQAVRARLVIPIHYDDFTRPLDQPLRLMPRLLDDFDATMEFLARRTAAIPSMRLAMLRAWETVPLLPLEPVATVD